MKSVAATILGEFFDTLEKEEGFGEIAPRRAQRIFLTERARALQAPAIEAASGVNTELLANLDADERRDFIALMRKIITAEQQRAQRPD